MCVAIIKPEGVALLSDEVLERCFIHNPDGAGIAVPSVGGAEISKGYFDFDQYLEAVKSMVTTKKLAFLHMRIATLGQVDEGNCHPFPLCDDYELMRNMELVQVGTVMMHNGTFDMDNEVDSVSDTMTFAKAVYTSGLDPFKDSSRFLIDQIAHPCRVAFMRGEHWTTFGKWETKDGCMFSNDSFRRPVYPKAHTHSRAWSTGAGTWTSKDGYKLYSKDYLEPEQIEQVALGYDPLDGSVLTDNHRGTSSKYDYSVIVKWLNEADDRELRLSGVDKETIKYCQEYRKVKQNGIIK